MRVGFTCSCFDLLHAGHVLMLREAKEQCDYLLVGLQVSAYPRKNHPIQSLVSRYTQLQALKFVDEIIPYEGEDGVLDILSMYPVDVRILGEEYKELDFTGKELPIEIYFNRRGHHISTSSIIEAIKNG